MKPSPVQKPLPPSIANGRHVAWPAYLMGDPGSGARLTPALSAKDLDLEAIRVAIREELAAVLNAQAHHPSPVPLFVLPPLLTTEEFGFLANRSADWVRDQICTGRIRAHGRPWAIPYRELEKYRVDLATAAQRLSQRSVEPSAA